MKEHSWFDQNKHGFVLKRLHLEPKASSNNLIYPSMHVLMYVLISLKQQMQLNPIGFQ